MDESGENLQVKSVEVICGQQRSRVMIVLIVVLRLQFSWTPARGIEPEAHRTKRVPADVMRRAQSATGNVALRPDGAAPLLATQVR